MTTIYDIKKRAQQLSEKTDSETISPQEVGGLFSDLADYTNDVEVNGSSLGIRKTYTSVSAMEADKNPVGDDGKPLKKGQLVNIYNQDDPSSADNNKVFSWQNPGWQIRTTLDAGYATREELTELENNITININALENSTGQYTLEQAIALVPEDKKKLGLKIRFRNSISPQNFTEATYIAADVSEDNWNNLNHWKTEEKTFNDLLLQSGIYNINYIAKNPTGNYTLQTARNNIKEELRYFGCCLIYRVSATNYEQAYYNKAVVDNDSWNNDENWIVSNALVDKKSSTININVLQNNTNTYTLEQAIVLVPKIQRNLGTKIKFRSASNPQKWVEATYIAGGVEDENWNNTAFWITNDFSYSLNINSLLTNSESYTLEQAVKFVPKSQRQLGTKIRFRSSSNPVKITEAIFLTKDVSDQYWNDAQYWSTIEYSGNTTFNIQNSIKNEIININVLQNNTNTYTLQQAIALVPENQRVLGTKIRFRSSTTPQKFTEATYMVADVSKENWSNKNFWFTCEFGVIAKTRWFALGDSITQGYYSKDGKLIGVTNYNYPYYVGIINNYEVTNYGVGGSGYVHNATVEDGLNAKDKVDTIDFSNCDLVTLAWGVNDWHYNCKIGDISSSTQGDGTMVGNMMYCIEKILTDNPKCKIIVILPQNASAFGGDIESNWGLGTNLETSGTLQSVIDAQISVCQYYGIQYIDQTKQGIVNRFNIQSLLPDGLHPAEDGYINMAKYISKQLQYA